MAGIAMRSTQGHRRTVSESWKGKQVSYFIVKGKIALFQKAGPYFEARPENIDAEYYDWNKLS
jgi:DNA polymerase elongation subunit (family B)